MKRWRVWAGVVPAAALVLLAVWEVWVTLAVPREVASDGDWAAAAAEVRAGFRPGDLIVFAPAWADPIGRRELGDLIPLDDAARMDSARFARIWEVSLRGASNSEAARAHRVSSHGHGGVRVRLFEQTPVKVKTDFVAQATIARFEGGSGVPIVEEVGFQPHKCLRVEPAPGATVRVVWPAAELGRELVGYVGLADVFTRRDIRSPGTLELSIGGKSVAKRVVGVDDGWVRFAAPTTPGPAEVVFALSARDPRRLICFAAEARE